MTDQVARVSAAQARYWSLAGPGKPAGGPYSVGYSQPNRLDVYRDTDDNGALKCDTSADCGTLVMGAINYGLRGAYPLITWGHPVLFDLDAYWTGNLRGGLEARGFREVKWNDADLYPQGGFKQGDVVLSAGDEGGVGHVAMVTGAAPGEEIQLSEAWIAEGGDIHGVPGDTTGTETRTVAYATHLDTARGVWTSCHRFDPALFAIQHPDVVGASSAAPAPPSAPGPVFGVDISNHQAGIDLAAVNPGFVIVMATQGDWFTNPYFNEQVNAALALGRPTGVYHYVDGSGVGAEVAHFLDVVGAHLAGQRVFWAIDWEAGQNDVWGDEGYLRAVVDAVKARAGRRGLLYASSSVYPWGVQAATECVPWVAQYASDEPVGWDANPWTDGTWPTAGVIHQYADTGRLPGYGGNLDLNVYHGAAADLRALAGADTNPNVNINTGNRRSGMLLIETTTPWGATAWALITPVSGAVALDPQQAQAYNAATGYCGRVPWDHYELLVREAWQRRNELIKALGGEVRESVDTATRRFLEAVKASCGRAE